MILKYTRDSFNIRDRIEGATNRCIILKGNNGEKVFCTNKLFNKIMHNPSIEFIIDTLPAHVKRDSFGSKETEFPESKWITAFLPSRF